MTELITLDERSRLYQLEETIRQGLNTFVDVGNALLEIRDKRLYRQDYSTFEEYCNKQWSFSRDYAKKLMRSADVIANLENDTIVSFLPKTESQTRPLTSLEPAEQVEAWRLAVETAPETGITAKHVQAVVDEIQNKPHVSFNSGNNEWYTPPEYIEAAKFVMGGIDLDPASSETANGIVEAASYLTAEQDGLRFEWAGKVWMNPPYASELIGKFTEKLVTHFESGEIEEAVVLVNNATETVWFQRMLVSVKAVCFLNKRVKFIDSTGYPTGAPLQGQAILYFGNKVNAFADTFSQFGKVLYG